jgi:mutator protein MutT
MHVSAGAIIKNENGDVLMIDRKIEPFGWACPAGHVDSGETPAKAMVREVKEEMGLNVVEYELLHHEFVAWNTCSHGVRGHDWYVFVVQKFDGDVFIEKKEVKNYQWVPAEKMDTLSLEKVWGLWYDKKLI